MELYRLGAKDYHELIHLLDGVFSHHNKKEQHFEEELPKMCVADDLHMNRHLGIKEDGKLVATVGIYPLPATVSGTPVLFSTVGNVATHPDYEGRGYMSMLLHAAMKELEVMGADVSRLGGSKHRYNRFGYEGAGTLYTFTFTPHNLRCRFPHFESSHTLRPIEKADQNTLAHVWDLYSQNKIAVNRLEMPAYADVYHSLTAWRCRGYAMENREGVLCGYLSADPDGNVTEWGAVTADVACEMLALWQSTVQKSITVPVAPYQSDMLAKLSTLCEGYTVNMPSLFKIINWEKTVGAFLGLKASYTALPDGEWVLGIQDYGNIMLTVSGGETACRRTEKTSDCQLPPLAATRLLFGPMPAAGVLPLPPAVNAWLPLPLSWNLQDRV